MCIIILLETSGHSVLGEPLSFPGIPGGRRPWLSPKPQTIQAESVSLSPQLDLSATQKVNALLIPRIAPLPFSGNVSLLHLFYHILDGLTWNLLPWFWIAFSRDGVPSALLLPWDFPLDHILEVCEPWWVHGGASFNRWMSRCNLSNSSCSWFSFHIDCETPKWRQCM